MSKEQIIELLEKSGWYMDRHIDVEEVLSKLKKEGYVYNKIQKEFLQSYEGISIEFDNPRLPGAHEILEICALDTAITIFRSVVEEYEQFCESKFLIVGKIDQEHMTVYINDKGVFYGGYDDCLICLGNDFEECLYNLINGVELELMYVE